MTLQGLIHHFLGALQPAPDRRPAFLSVYIHDTDFDVQSELRSQNFAGVDRALLKNLASVLNQSSMYVQSFMSLHELARDNAPTNRYEIVIHADKRPANEHVRCYNGPSYSVVAALIPGNEDGMIVKRDILVRKRAQRNSNGNEFLDKVSISHSSYDPLSYVILFPSGTDGWHPELQFDAVERQRKLTLLMFYSWRIFQRRDEFSTVLSGGRLFQDSLADQFCKMEAERLS